MNRTICNECDGLGVPCTMDGFGSVCTECNGEGTWAPRWEDYAKRGYCYVVEMLTPDGYALVEAFKSVEEAVEFSNDFDAKGHQKSRVVLT